MSDSEWLPFSNGSRSGYFIVGGTRVGYSTLYRPRCRGLHSPSQKSTKRDCFFSGFQQSSTHSHVISKDRVHLGAAGWGTEHIFRFVRTHLRRCHRNSW